MNEDKLKKLNDLFNDTLDKFNAIKDTVALKDSFPIMWFGDLETYDKPGCKIVTIASHPSEHEFDGMGTREERFVGINQPVEKDDFERYTKSLCKYFNNNPYYKEWFYRFDDIISPIYASYKRYEDGKKNTAIHIDFVPVASKLWKERGKECLLKEYNGYINKLLGILDPDVLVVSADNGMLRRIIPNLRSNNHVPTKLPSKYLFDLRLKRLNDHNYKVSDDGNKLLIWGKPMFLPFGYLSDDEIKVRMKPS